MARGAHPIPQLIFHGPQDLFSWITAGRALGDPADPQLPARLQRDSHRVHLQAGTGGRIDVLQVDLLDADGTRRARSAEGSYTFYVLREEPDGLHLLEGQMFGSRYQSRLEDGHLDFQVELHHCTGTIVPPRFRVEARGLLNLSAPADDPLDPRNGIARRS